MEQISIPMITPEHIPGYVTSADGSDGLMKFMVVFVIVVILLLGVGYLSLHALPERLAHRASHNQLQVISILAILALFTHNNIFWIAALLLATFKLPDYLGPLRSIAISLRDLSGRDGLDPDLSKADEDAVDTGPGAAPDAGSAAAQGSDNRAPAASMQRQG